MLTPRQRAVKALLERGLTVKQVAAELGISPSTVRQHHADGLERERAEWDEDRPDRSLAHTDPWLHAYVAEFDRFMRGDPQARLAMRVALLMARRRKH